MARLLGSSSILHYGHQTIQDASVLEKARMDHNLLRVDEDMRQNLFLILKNEQEAIVQRFSTTSVERHLLIEGGSGGGKTVSVMAIALKLMDQMMVETEARRLERGQYTEEENTEEKADPEDDITEGNKEPEKDISPVLILSCYGLTAASQLLQNLKELAKDLGCLVRGLSWKDMLHEYGVKEYAGNLPLTIVSLAQALGAQYKGRSIVFILDELRGYKAPRTGSPPHHDYSFLTNAVLPENVRLLCCMNPTNDLPLLLTPCQPSFVTVNSEKQYRNTQTLIKLGNLLMTKTGWGMARNDEVATDVPGFPARLTRLGKLEEVETPRQVLLTEMAVMKEEGRKPGVILYHNGDISSEVKTTVEQEGAAAGWQVRDIDDFKGSEEDNIIYLGPGYMECFTRAKLHLSVVLFWDPKSGNSGIVKRGYGKFSEALQPAESLDLVVDVTPSM
jgi:hypothetical protein